MYEGGLTRIDVPSRNIAYVIKVIGSEASTLPPPLLTPGSTILNDNGDILLKQENPTNNPTPTSLQAKIQDVIPGSETQLIEVKKQVIPVNNCGGNTPFSQQYNLSQTYIHKFVLEHPASLDAETSAVLSEKITPVLQNKYGYENNQIETIASVEFNMTAEPKTKTNYTVTWQEVWETGIAKVIIGTDLINIPFKVKTNLVYQIESEKVACP